MNGSSIVILKSDYKSNLEYRVAVVEHTDLLYNGIDDEGHWIPNSNYIHDCFDSAKKFYAYLDAFSYACELGSNPIQSIDIWDHLEYNSL